LTSPSFKFESLKQVLIPLGKNFECPQYFKIGALLKNNKNKAIPVFYVIVFFEKVIMGKVLAM
jgi:hypothetical protein